jgi:fluoride exporter
MTGTAFLAVALGGVLGCTLRWFFGTLWNASVPALPMGTLASNLVGGYLVGIAVAYFSANAALPPEWRLFCITGFLGGLTTFSTFSAENVQLLLDGRIGAATLHAGVHLFGSLALTAAGIFSYRALA